jgi:hypothetical protein
MLNDPEGAGAPSPENPEAARWRKALVTVLEGNQLFVTFCEALSDRIVNSKTWLCTRDKDGKFEPTAADAIAEITFVAALQRSVNAQMQAILGAEEIAEFEKLKASSPPEAVLREAAEQMSLRGVRALYADPTIKAQKEADLEWLKALRDHLFSGLKKGGLQ